MTNHGVPATQAGGLARLWAGWRMPYLVEGADEREGDEGCVFCRILTSTDPPEATYVLWRDDCCAAVLNAYPYTSGHLLVLPVRHLGELEELTADEAAGTWATVTDAVRALKSAYSPEGVNVGINLGRAAGAGVPGHFHVHCLPRWDGDTNFMTTVAETRVVPESLPSTFERLRAAWP